MTIENRKLAIEGKMMWNEYVNINGYAFQPNKKGIDKLSKILDLNVKYLNKCIGLYLEC